MLAWPPRAGCALCCLVALACSHRDGTRDAAATATDSAISESARDVWELRHPDLGGGLAGGASCDSSAQCLSGGCTLGVCSDWTHAMRIDIDSSSHGAALTQTVTDFPLLVRLRATNFVFAEARGDGADLRFVDHDGRSLSHEIERWDPSANQGDMWVLVPRIEGDREDNHILLYWGNPQAAATASGPSVFGDLLCALHMGQSTDGVPAHLQDSSGSANTAELKNQPADSPRAEGVAGPGLALDGAGAYVGTSTLRVSPSTFAISLWLKTTSTTPAGVAGFVDKDHLRFAPGIWMDEYGRLTFGVQRTTGGLLKVSSLTGYNDGAWHHVVARFSSSGQYLFVDGEAIADDPTRSGTTTANGSWCFGQDPVAAPSQSNRDAAASGYYTGSLDEIRVATSEASAAWIKLAYATQRPDATAVRYQPLP